jgi:hypothetical protein
MLAEAQLQQEANNDADNDDDNDDATSLQLGRTC